MISKIGKLFVEKPRGSILFDLYFQEQKIGCITTLYLHIGKVDFSLTPEETINLGILYHECLKWLNQVPPCDRAKHVITNLCNRSEFKITKFKIE